MARHMTQSKVTPAKLLKHMEKKSPCVMAAIRHLQEDSLRYIEVWVQQCRAPNADLNNIREQIATQVESVFGIRTAVAAAKNPDDQEKGGSSDKVTLGGPISPSHEGATAEYAECCRDLAGYPEQTVAMAFGILRQKWADALAAEKELMRLERPLRAAFASLDGRTQYIMATLGNMLAREGLLDFLDDIYHEVTDSDFLCEKEDEFRDDPQLAIFVRLNNLLGIVDAGKSCAV